MHAMIGVDLGTTNTKVCAYDGSGRLLSGASRPTRVFLHENDRSEFDVEAIWGCVRDCLREVIAGCGCPVASIGISSFGESSVLLDREDKPVYPMITWFDQRTVSQAEALCASMAPNEIHRLTGQFASPKSGICKVMWICENAPDAYRRAVLCLSMLDYIIYRLTGIANMDYTMASRMMLLDLQTLTYAEPILQAAGIRRELFPPIRPSGSVVGTVKPDILREIGAGGEIPVLAGGHDHACAAVAAHVLDDAAALDSMGTAETILIASGSLPDMNRCYQNQVSIYPHFGGKLYRMTTSIQACGICLDWAGGNLLSRDAKSGSKQKAFADYLAEGISRPHKERLIFCPNIRGLQEFPSGRGAFFGLDDTCTLSDLAYSVAEGLGFEGYRRLNGCLAGTGQEVSCVRVVGGPSKLEPLVQIKCDIMGRRLQLPIISDAACLGAALIAGIGAGAIKELPPLEIQKTCRPNPARRHFYRSRYPLYEKALSLIMQF